MPQVLSLSYLSQPILSTQTQPCYQALLQLLMHLKVIPIFYILLIIHLLSPFHHSLSKVSSHCDFRVLQTETQASSLPVKPGQLAHLPS
jgi:hypothetical protein